VRLNWIATLRPPGFGEFLPGSDAEREMNGIFRGRSACFRYGARVDGRWVPSAIGEAGMTDRRYWVRFVEAPGARPSVPGAIPRLRPTFPGSDPLATGRPLDGAR